MAYTINQADVMSSLTNLMGYRVSPGGTTDDLNRYIQESFNYCWRYYRWGFSLKTGTVAADGILPEDFDLEGWRKFDGVSEINLEDTLSTASSGSAIIFDTADSRFKLTPAVACTVAYQYFPPTLGTDSAGSAPFPSAQVVAMGALIFEKLAANPTRADIQQEWDLFHAELDRLVGRAYANTPRRPRNYHDMMGTHTGDVSG